MADPEEGPGGPESLLTFRPNWGPKGQKKLFETGPPPYLMVWMTGPPSLSKGLDPPLLDLPQVDLTSFYACGASIEFTYISWSEKIYLLEYKKNALWVTYSKSPDTRSNRDVLFCIQTFECKRQKECGIISASVKVAYDLTVSTRSSTSTTFKFQACYVLGTLPFPWCWQRDSEAQLTDTRSVKNDMITSLGAWVCSEKRVSKTLRPSPG